MLARRVSKHRAPRVTPPASSPSSPPAPRCEQAVARSAAATSKRAGRARPPPAVRRARPRYLPPGAAVGRDAACRRWKP